MVYFNCACCVWTEAGGLLRERRAKQSMRQCVRVKDRKRLNKLRGGRWRKRKLHLPSSKNQTLWQVIRSLHFYVKVRCDERILLLHIAQITSQSRQQHIFSLHLDLDVNVAFISLLLIPLHFFKLGSATEPQAGARRSVCMYVYVYVYVYIYIYICICICIYIYIYVYVYIYIYICTHSVNTDPDQWAAICLTLFIYFVYT